MPRLPRLKGVQVIKTLRHAGFELIRVKESHHFLQHQDERGTVVPVHAGEIIGPGLLSKILRDCELTVEAFIELSQ